MTPERTQRIENVLNNRQPDLCVVLENVHDPHNISAVMRTCDSVGVQDLFILNTTIAQHEKFGKRSAASAERWLNIHLYDNATSCFEQVRKRCDKVYATHLAERAASLYDLKLTEPLALVFGNEHGGISEESLSLCDGNFIIPQVGMVQSLNISVACAVSLYEAFRQRTVAGQYGEGRLPDDIRNSLALDWARSKKEKAEQ